MDIKKQLKEKALANEWKTLKEFDEHYKQPKYMQTYVKGVHDLAHRLDTQGGFAQQQRMISDKRKALDRALFYSYQGAFIEKYPASTLDSSEPIRALINPNKLKQDYDDKIISVGFEHGFKTGDIFKWSNTGTYWLIYLQDLTELAYFRGDIRKCSFEISWLEDGEQYTTYAAVRGPVETKINSTQAHSTIIDNPNYSLSILMPLNDHTKKYFQRYSKFYLQDDTTCWRVEATDWISTPGVLEVLATEYYANKDEDDIENGIVGALIVDPVDPNPTVGATIVGDTFIKVKQTSVYIYKGREAGRWYIKENVPVKIEIGISSEGYNQATITWTASYHGQFTLYYGTGLTTDATKVIIAESLF